MDSQLLMESVTFSNSTSILFNSQKSSVTINQLNYQNITEASNLFQVSNSFDVIIKNVRVSESEVTKDEFFRVSKSENVTLEDIVISNFPKTVLSISSSTIKSLKSLEFTNSSKAINIQSSTIMEISNITLDSNGAIDSLKGGAIYMVDSSVTIINSTISNNKAREGAAIYFSCSSLLLCSLSISNVSFVSNSATKGGAIFYDHGRPNLGENIVFINNIADYGPDIASYGVKITMAEDPNIPLKIEDFGSGIKYDQLLKLAVRDFDDQIMVLNNENQIIMNAVNSEEAEVKGFNSASLVNGVAKFYNFIVVAESGSEGILISISSNAVDSKKVEEVFGNLVNNNTIELSFRFCKPGEWVLGKS